MRADDQVLSRKVTSDAPRDNVIFELGLFMGAISRARSYLIVPRDMSIKIPTDVLGINPMSFDHKSADLAGSLAFVCAELSSIVRKLGAR